MRMYMYVIMRYVYVSSQLSMSLGLQANKAAELLAACNFDLNAVAKSIVTAIERKAEIDECFEPKVRRC